MSDLRDTGRPRIIEDEREHMSGARAFDDLVSANLLLVRTLRRALWVCAAGGIFAITVTCACAASLHMGQQETQHLIRTLDRLNCEEKKSQ